MRYYRVNWLFLLIASVVASLTVNAQDERAENMAEASKQDKVEIPGRRTLVSKHFRNADGTYTGYFYTGPVHYKDEDGCWQDIDLSARPVHELPSRRLSSFGVESRNLGKRHAVMDMVVDDQGVAAQPDDFCSGITNNNFGFFLPDKSKKPICLSISRQEQMFFLPLGCSGNIKPTLVGDEYVYEQLWPSASLAYRVIPTGIKERIIITSPSAPHEYRFFVGCRGCQLQTEENIIEIVDNNDTRLGVIEYPWVRDASGTPGPKMGFTLSRTADGYTITMSVDREWLGDEDRLYPVEIDPTVTLTNLLAILDTYVNAGGEWNTSHGTSTKLCIGNWNCWFDGWEPHRILMRFNVSSLPGYALINSAKIMLYCYNTTSSGTLNSANMYEVVRTWTNAATWGTDSNNYNPNKLLGTATLGGPGFVGWSTYPFSSGGLSTIISWRDNIAPNYGIMLMIPQTSGGPFRYYYSSESSINKPYLEINYSFSLFASTQITTQQGNAQINWVTNVPTTNNRVLLYLDDTFIAEFPGTGENSTTHSVTITDLNLSGTYKIKLSAVWPPSGATETSDIITIPDTLAPPVPAVTSTTRDDTNRSITVSWGQVADPTPGFGLQGYKVRYSINAGAWVEAGSLITATSWTKTGLRSTDAIRFQICAQDWAGNCSAWSAATDEECLAALPPTKVVSLTSTLSAENPRYRINVVVEAVPDTAGYRIYRRFNGGEPTYISTTQTSYEDTDLNAHGVYEYGYATYNALGEQSGIQWADSRTLVSPGQMAPKIFVLNIPPEVSASGPPAGAVTITNSVDFTLGSAMDVEGDALEYRLYRRDQNGGNITLLASWPPPLPLADNASVTATFPNGAHEWSIYCIERNEGIIDRTEVAVTPWTLLTVSICEPVPYCEDIFGTRNVGTKGQNLDFDVELPDGAPTNLTFAWDFGDGATASGRQASHGFTTLGPQNVTLTVIDGAGPHQYPLIVNIQNTNRGMLYANETWSGMHQVIGDITVPAGLSLAIAPNTTVTFKSNCQLIIDGTLTATGGNVVFDLEPNTTVPWDGIMVKGYQAVSLSDMAIRHAVRGLACVGAGSVTLNNVTFEYNHTALHCFNGHITITGCTFANNEVYGIKEDNGCSPLVLNSRFINNGMDYYDEYLTAITVDELNALPGNGGNTTD